MQLGSSCQLLNKLMMHDVKKTLNFYYKIRTERLNNGQWTINNCEN